MPSFNISDITAAGTFANAVTVARDSDHRNAAHHTGPDEGPNATGFLTIQSRG
jgi:hypothetical protein